MFLEGQLGTRLKLLFQTLDDKKECVAFYIEDRLTKEKPANLTKTWNYTNFLQNEDIEYASLYCHGQSLEEVCPEHLKAEWRRISSKLKAFLISIREAKINLNDLCFYDLVPQRFLFEFCDLKNKISENVFETYRRPKNYDFLSDLLKVTEEIRFQKLNIDITAMNGELATFRGRQFFKKISKTEPCIKYDIFGSKTGRLTTKKNSFPILNLDKNYRKILKPNNDWLVELDFNAAELRTLLALCGQQQPEEDIHEYNAKNIYGNLTREEAKKRIFAWLYNPESTDRVSNGVYDREEVIKKYFNGSQVTTFFDRTIPSDKHHALNYIIQSTTSDLFLHKMIDLWKFLKHKKSFVAFSVHDSLVIDMASDERDLINQIVKIFSRTKFGDFKVNVSVGKDFGNMRKIK